MNHWAARYVGSAWESGGRGPHTFDCWGLLWWVYREEFGVVIPEYLGIAEEDTLAISKAMSAAASGGGEWTRIPLPSEGCAVAMSAKREFHHVGIFTLADGGLVVHAGDRSRVVAESTQRLRAGGWRRIEFFQHKDL